MLKNSKNKSPKAEKTSWGNVAEWYDKHLADENTYHAQVVLPNLVRVVDLEKNESLVELGCGQGYFIEKFLEISLNVTGVEIGKPLVEIAKKKFPKAKFVVGNAEDPNILAGQTFDVITCVLALQNMKNLGAVVKNMERLLAPGGRAVLVLNHPAFRVPQKSAWGMDGTVQYRRVDAYMSEAEIKIDMAPGKRGKGETTLSYHRPLQAYMKTFAKEGFAVTKLEEWISHRTSQPGPHAKAEDTARKEIPLFMCLVLRKV